METKSFSFKVGKHSFISTDYCYLSEASGEEKNGVPTNKRVCTNCANLIDLNNPSPECQPRMRGEWYIPYLPLFK